MPSCRRIAPLALALLLSTTLPFTAQAEAWPTASPSMQETFRQLARELRPAFCFAPDTPQSYVEQMTQLYGGGPDPLLQPGDEAFSRFQLGNRWTTTATDGGGLTQGDPMTLTWSYVPDGTAITGQLGEPNAPSNFLAWINGIYGNFNAWHPLFVQVFDRWSQLTGIRYVYEPNDDGVAMFNSSGLLGVRGDVRIGAHFIDGNSNVLAYNFFPNNGDMVIDSADNFFNTTTSNSLRLRNMLAHEHGHGIGLSHVCPVNQTKLMEPFISLSYDGPRFDDTLAGQRHYGDTLEFDLNDTSGEATVLGALGTTALTVGDVSIDDNSDVDWYRFSVGALTTVTVNLRPQGLTYLDGPQNSNGTCTAGTNLNTLIFNDLGFDVVASNGSTVLSTANSGGAGVDESASVLLATPGNYFVRVFGGAANQVQAYTLEITQSIFADGFETGNTLAWDVTVP